MTYVRKSVFIAFVLLMAAAVLVGTLMSQEALSDPLGKDYAEKAAALIFFVYTSIAFWASMKVQKHFERV